MTNDTNTLSAEDFSGAEALPVEPEAVQAARARLAPKEGIPTMEGRTTIDDRPPLDIGSNKSSASIQTDADGKVLTDAKGKALIENPPELKRNVPKSYEAGAFYRVQLSKAIEVAGELLIPANIHTLEGSICEKNASDIHAAEKA